MEIKAEEHLGLVMRVVKPYAAALKTAIMDSEVFSDGCIGLMKAVEAYDPELGFQFSTFATTCIETAIRDGFRQRRRRAERKYKDGSVVRMHVSSKCAELSQVCDDTLNRVIGTENEDRLRSAIESLTGQQRTVIELRLEGHGLKEVGEIMGYSKQRAEQVEKMARRAIVDILTGERNCVPADSF
jgi:RNA polymerase sporulation-specific sigma factor